MELNLSEDTKRVMRDIFQSKDVDSNGVIDSKELRECLMAVGFCPTADDITFLSEHFDNNGDGKLQIEELIENLDVINAHSIKGDDLVSAFEKFDLSDDGYIRQHELMTILTQAGKDKMTTDEAEELIQDLLEKFDINKDGKFSYPEFVRILMQTDLDETPP